MKTVFSSHSEVAHVWAQQKQDEGRANNIFFEGDTIYSYGRHFPIARFVKPDVILFTTRSYSTSTSGHCSMVQSAIGRGITILSVFNPCATCENQHIKNLDNIRVNMEELDEKRIRATTYGYRHIKESIARLNTFRAYVKLFRIKSKLPSKLRKVFNMDDEALQIILDEERVEFDKYREQENIEAAERAKKAEIKAQEVLRLWIAGEPVRVPYGLSNSYLRIKGDDIQTSQGARIPLKNAALIWAFIQSKLGTGYKAADNGDSLERRVNAFFHPYEVREITLDGDMLIGCHSIPYSEFERMAKELHFI